MIRKHFTALFLLSLCFAVPMSLRAQETTAASPDQKKPAATVPEIGRAHV